MELRDALKALRSEIGVTQTELASVLRVNTSTVARRESGMTLPYRTVFSSLLEYAKSHQVSDICMRNLSRLSGIPEKVSSSR